MRCKLDENLPLDLVRLLRDAGYDALSVTEQEPAGADDARLAVICQDERRALLTLDLDFADIRAYPQAKYQEFAVFRLARRDSPILQMATKVVAVSASRSSRG